MTQDNSTAQLEPTLAEVHAFLLGEGPLIGCWFGDDTRPPLHQSQPYWWRKYLRTALIEALTRVQPSIGDKDARDCEYCGWTPNCGEVGCRVCDHGYYG